MAKTVTLKRFAINERPKVSEEIKQLARDAMVILDYDDLADQVLDSTEKLGDVLRRLDIRPFNFSHVRLYKEQKREEANKEKNAYQYWHRTPLKNQKSVPEFVLRKAIEIKRASPDVKLFVDTLDDDPDPFLVAVLGKEYYYVEVWDESEFENGI